MLKVKPPLRLEGGLLLFSSDAHKEAYIEQLVQALLQEKIGEHIRDMGLTAEEEAEEWAAIAVAQAMVTSRKEATRHRKRESKRSR
jgi:hypothetical protein